MLLVFKFSFLSLPKLMLMSIMLDTSWIPYHLYMYGIFTLYILVFFYGKSREIYQSHGFFGDDSTPIKPSAHTRPSCWRMGGIRAELRVQALEPTARLRLEMDTFCDFSLKYSWFLKGVEMTGWFTVGFMEFFEAKRFWFRWVCDNVVWLF